MRSAAIIKGIEPWPPAEQAEVIQFTCGLARSRQMAGKEFGELAAPDDPAESIRLKSAMTL